jgi:hypothetical protein
MRLPYAQRAVIAREKLTDYLLSPRHAVGKDKAAWFAAFGCSAARWTEFAAALERHARDNDVAERRDTPRGIYYIIEGALDTPDRRNPAVRSVWLVRTGEDFPRFVTAYPARRGA